MILSSFDLGLPATEEAINSAEPSDSREDTFSNHEGVQEDMLHEIYRDATEVSVIISILFFSNLHVCIVLDIIMLSSYISDRVLSCMSSVSFTELRQLMFLIKRRNR